MALQIDPRVYQQFNKDTMDPRVRALMQQSQQLQAPNPFEVSGASPATTADLLGKQIAQMPPTPPRDTRFDIQSPYEAGTPEDFYFRRDTGKLQMEPANPEVNLAPAPATPTPTPEIKAPSVPDLKVPEPELPPTPTVEEESPTQKAFGQYEALLQSKTAQLTKDVESASKDKWPQLIAAAFAGYGDALVATSGGQSDFMGNVLKLGESKRAGLEKRKTKLGDLEMGLPLLRAQTEEKSQDRREKAIERGEAKKYKRERDVLTDEYRKRNLALNERYKGARADYYSEFMPRKFDWIQKEDIEKEVEKHGSNVAKTRAPQMLNNFIELDRLLGGLDSGEDVPGKGIIASDVPAWWLSDKGRAVRQRVQKIINIQLKDRSGAAVTDSEYARFLREVGEGRRFPTEKELRRYLIGYGREVQMALGQWEASTSQEALDQYRTKPGAVLSEMIPVRALNMSGGQNVPRGETGDPAGIDVDAKGSSQDPLGIF